MPFPTLHYDYSWTGTSPYNAFLKLHLMSTHTSLEHSSSLPFPIFNSHNSTTTTLSLSLSLTHSITNILKSLFIVLLCQKIMVKPSGSRVSLFLFRLHIPLKPYSLFFCAEKSWWNHLVLGPFYHESLSDPPQSPLY